MVRNKKHKNWTGNPQVGALCGSLGGMKGGDVEEELSLATFRLPHSLLFLSGQFDFRYIHGDFTIGRRGLGGKWDAASREKARAGASTFCFKGCSVYRLILYRDYGQRGLGNSKARVNLNPEGNRYLDTCMNLPRWTMDVSLRLVLFLFTIIVSGIFLGGFNRFQVIRSTWY